jgi:hemoglobin
MIVEYTRYRISEDRREAFIKGYEKAAEHLAASPACLAYELTHCTEEPDRYILRIKWKSTEEHIQGFRKEPGFRDFFQLVRPFFQDIEEMQHYELTKVVHRT